MNGDDPEAVVKHLYAISEAIFQSGKFESVAGYSVVDGKLISEWLKLKVDPPQVLPQPPAILPANVDSCAHKWFLKCLPEGMLLKCLVDKGMYSTTDNLLIPDFDCDDFAWMAMNWMRRTLLHAYPNSIVRLWTVCWTCPDGTKSCHAILKIENEGLIWYYDPQSDKWDGPYPNTIEWEDQLAILKRLLAGMACNGADWWEVPIRPNTLPWEWFPIDFPEAPPFDEPLRNPLDPLIPMCLLLPGQDENWEKFKRLLAECCATLTHPTVPALPVPSVTPGDCPQLPTPTFTNNLLWWWPDLCDPNNYTRPPNFVP